jgi:hypothetical protein
VYSVLLHIYFCEYHAKLVAKKNTDRLRLLSDSLNEFLNKDGNPSTKSTRHVDANVNARKENLGHQNSINEMEDVILKSTSGGGALDGMCEKDENL